MNIAICDDEKAQAALLRKYAGKWAERSSISASIDVYASAEAFLFAWPEERQYDLLLLDIEMPGQNGMELARTIRKTDEALAIVFVTGHSDYIEEGYDVSALHYLIKPVDERKLSECLDRASKRAAATPRSILIQSGGETLRIAQDRIVSIEAFAHEVQIASVDGTFRAGISIGELENELDGVLFVRPHRSYIVGLQYIRQIGRDELLLDNGARVPVSRRRYEELNRAFIGFYRGVQR